MAENYIVNYQINVNSNPALESIRKFQQATAEMEALTKRFDIVAKSIGKVNSALDAYKILKNGLPPIWYPVPDSHNAFKHTNNNICYFQKHVHCISQCSCKLCGFH